MKYIHTRTIETTKTCLQLALRVVNLEEYRIKATASKPQKPKNRKKHPDKLSYQIDLLFTSILILLCFEQPLNMLNHHFQR